VGGEWIESTGDRWIAVENPATETVIAEVPEGTPQDVDRAVSAARQAFPQWSATPIAERAWLLAALRDGVAARQAELASTITSAVRIANSTRYGLAGAVWSADRDRAVAVARRLRTGQVDINGARFNPSAPFGGYKQSGYGRELGRHGLQEFQLIKSLQLP